MNRRDILKLLSTAAPAAVIPPLMPEPPLPLMLRPTGIPFADPPDPAGLIMPLPYKEPSPFLMSLVHDISAWQKDMLCIDDDYL